MKIEHILLLMVSIRSVHPANMATNPPNLLNNPNENGLFVTLRGQTFAAGTSHGEFILERSNALHGDCLFQCLSHPLCGSVSVTATEPYRCLWSRYAIYAPQLAEAGPGWTLYTRTKGIGIYGPETRYTFTKAAAADYCRALGGTLSTEAEIVQLVDRGMDKCKWAHTTSTPCSFPCTKPRPGCCETSELRTSTRTMCEAWCSFEKQSTALVYTYTQP